MTPRLALHLWLGLLSGWLGVRGTNIASAQTLAVPSVAEAAALLSREPMSQTNWPTWRKRLREWIADSGSNTDRIYEAARAFLRSQADAQGELPTVLAKDALAWFLLGSAHLYVKSQGDRRSEAVQAERAFRRSIELDPTFARAHRNLAVALWMQVQPSRQRPPGSPAAPVDEKETEGRQELDRARQLDPTLKLRGYEGFYALIRGRFAEAETLYREALEEQPGNIELARSLAQAVLRNPRHRGVRAASIQPLLERFPNDGVLICEYAVSLAADNDPRSAARELARARSLGTEPATILPKHLVAAIETEAARKQAEEASRWWRYGVGGLLGLAVLFALGLLLREVPGVMKTRRVV